MSATSLVTTSRDIVSTCFAPVVSAEVKTEPCLRDSSAMASSSERRLMSPGVAVGMESKEEFSRRSTGGQSPPEVSDVPGEVCSAVPTTSCYTTSTDENGSYFGESHVTRLQSFVDSVTSSASDVMWSRPSALRDFRSRSRALPLACTTSLLDRKPPYLLRECRPNGTADFSSRAHSGRVSDVESPWTANRDEPLDLSVRSQRKAVSISPYSSLRHNAKTSSYMDGVDYRGFPASDASLFHTASSSAAGSYLSVFPPSQSWIAQWAALAAASLNGTLMYPPPLMDISQMCMTSPNDVKSADGAEKGVHTNCYSQSRDSAGPPSFGDRKWTKSEQKTGGNLKESMTKHVRQMSPHLCDRLGRSVRDRTSPASNLSTASTDSVISRRLLENGSGRDILKTHSDVDSSLCNGSRANRRLAMMSSPESNRSTPVAELTHSLSPSQTDKHLDPREEFHQQKASYPELVSPGESSTSDGLAALSAIESFVEKSFRPTYAERVRRTVPKSGTIDYVPVVGSTNCSVIPRKRRHAVSRTSPDDEENIRARDVKSRDRAVYDDAEAHKRKKTKTSRVKVQTKSSKISDGPVELMSECSPAGAGSCSGPENRAVSPYVDQEHSSCEPHSESSIPNMPPLEYIRCQDLDRLADCEHPLESLEKFVHVSAGVFQPGDESVLASQAVGSRSVSSPDISNGSTVTKPGQDCSTGASQTLDFSQTTSQTAEHVTAGFSDVTGESEQKSSADMVPERLSPVESRSRTIRDDVIAPRTANDVTPLVHAFKNPASLLCCNM